MTRSGKTTSRRRVAPRRARPGDLPFAALRRPPTQARGRQRVIDVIDACERLLRRRRSEDLTMEDIARGARIQIGSLYHFFPDKTAVFVTVLERLLIEEGLTFERTPVDARRGLRDYLARLEARLVSVWCRHGSLLTLYYAFQRHPLVWKQTLAQRQHVAIQVGDRLRQLHPQVSRRRAIEQGRMLGVVMGLLIDNLAYLPPAARQTMRRETYDMLGRYVGVRDGA
jgi:AcrR family transcriptional regulator